MRTPHSMVMACIVLLIGLASNGFCAWTWTTLDCPAGIKTTPMGISGNNIVGTYYTGTTPHGFLYDRMNWTTLTHPGSQVIRHATGVSGDSIIGISFPLSGFSAGNPFLYKDGTYTRPDLPGLPTGIDGNMIVGTCYELDANVISWGFVYDGANWAPFNYPGSVCTDLTGISGNKIIGTYYLSSGGGGSFVFDGTWTVLQRPGRLPAFPNGIDGDNIVGSYRQNLQDHGFLYSGGSWITLDYPGALSTVATGISGNNIVGYYLDDSGRHGFLLTVPEPVTLSLLIAGGMLVYRRGRENGNRK